MDQRQLRKALSKYFSCDEITNILGNNNDFVIEKSLECYEKKKEEIKNNENKQLSINFFKKVLRGKQTEYEKTETYKKNRLIEKNENYYNEIKKYRKTLEEYLEYIPEIYKEKIKTNAKINLWYTLRYERNKDNYYKTLLPAIEEYKKKNPEFKQQEIREMEKKYYAELDFKALKESILVELFIFLKNNLEIKKAIGEEINKNKNMAEDNKINSEQKKKENYSKDTNED